MLTPADNVVALRPTTKTSGHDPVAFVERYWSGLRHGQTIPSRAQIDPRALKPVLQQVFILERVAPGMARFRIAGADLARATGMELRGMPISGIARPQARRDLEAVLETCFGTPAVTDVPIKMVPGSGGTAHDGTMLLLPMTGDDDTINRALGVLNLPPQAMTGNCRLDVGWHVARPVIDVDTTPTDKAQGFAEPTPAFHRQKLVLVHSRD